MNEQQHEMVLEVNHPSGAEGWYCPTCGRRILLRVPPNNGMVIVDQGDHYANHRGSVGGLSIGPVQAVRQAPRLDEISEERLRPWIKALEALDLNW